MSNAEEKAMKIEIQRQLADYDVKHVREIDAIVLWHLYRELGFRHDRLKRFYTGLNADLADLIKRYEMKVGDEVWLCTHLLKEQGIDLEKWEAEEKERG